MSCTVLAGLPSWSERLRQCEECLDKREILAAANFGEESKEREGRERDFVGKNRACSGQG